MSYRPLISIQSSDVTVLHNDQSEFFASVFDNAIPSRPTMQFQALQMAFSLSREKKSKTFENQIKCVIARTPCFLRN